VYGAREMSEQQKATPQIEQIEIDLSNIPLRPASKREIQQLEMALIIGTLYRPEVLELIKDPLEKATWVDSLAVAAAAIAREKAGYTVSQIADELGRSETTVRAHLSGKTKAGKLVRETYELLARGKLRIVAPFGGIQVTREEYEKLKQLEEKVKQLEEENRRLKQQLESCVKPEELENKLSELKSTIDELEKENEELRKRIHELEEKTRVVEEIRKLVCG